MERLTNEELTDLTIEELFDIYREEIDDKETDENLILAYDVPTTKTGKISYAKKNQKAYEEAKKLIIDDIIRCSRFMRKEETNLKTPDEAHEQLKKYIDSEEYKRNQELIKAQRQQIEQQRQQIEEQRKQIEELAKQTKAETSKLITEGIKSRVPRMPAIHEVPPPPAPPSLPPSFEPYGESDDFKRSHHQMNFNEYLKRTQESEILISPLIEYLNSNRNKWTLTFDQFKPSTLDSIKPHLVEWFKNKIGQLAINKHYKLQFRIKGDWKTVPLNGETYNQLLNKLESGSFVYDMEKMPTFEYEAGKEIKELPEWCLFDAIQIIPIERKPRNARFRINNDNGGHFFEYLADESLPAEVLEFLAKLQIFSSLSTDDKTQRKELNDCCFIYALQQTEHFTEEELNRFRLRIKSRYLSVSKLNEIANDQNKFKCVIHRIDPDDQNKHKSREIVIGPNNAVLTIEMNLFENHFFIHEKTPFTADYIKHIDEAPADAYNKRLRGDKWVSTNEAKRFMTSDKLVLELMKQNKFKPITYATAAILKTSLYDNIKDAEFPLEITDEKAVLKLIENKAPKTKNGSSNMTPPTYFYADFEADTSGEIHLPFMVCVDDATGEVRKCFKGPECAKEFLNFLPDGAVCYFHNFAYDWCMFNKYLTIQKVIKHGSKIYQATGFYDKKRLQFKDSLAVFMCKLETLPSSFKLEGIKKELFPYNYYTLERLASNIGIINEAGNHEIKRWTEKDYQTFNENIDAIEGCRVSETTFDMYKYAEFYCQQDVRILREAFEKLCDGFKNEFKIDVKSKLTTPAIAAEYFKQNVYVPNGNMFEVGGHVREFMSRAIYGGRCMCAYNRKWHSIKPISDYDAVSLYPSAMRRLWCVEGKPEVLNVIDGERVWSSMPDYLKQYNTKNGVGAFVVEIKIIKVEKHYAFPLIVQHTKDGNLNDDHLRGSELAHDNIKDGQSVVMVVDNIALEDLIEFQQISFQVVKGYVWNGKRDYKVQEVIQGVFDTRLKYKAEKNPLEQLYKLVMNSAYGKTIQKPVEFDLKYLSKKTSENEPISKFERYWVKNYNKITETVYENDKLAVVKVRKQINNHFNFSLFGIQVLSMSKRIMNEVMCLAFDLGCHVYYQDTDSMHIEADELPRLEKAFESKYGRKLCGKALGQFHSDFPTVGGHNEIPQAIESYFIAKKLYIDHLQDSTGETDFMVRGKGLTQKSIKSKAKREGGLMNLYNKLFNGDVLVFDLTDGQPCFDMTNGFTVSTKNEFKRRASTTYALGEREKYFSYAN